MNVSVILPSYDPSDSLPRAAKLLIESGFDDIIVINDGSVSGTEFFDEIASFPEVTLLVHEKNMGKGKALKTGFEYFLQNRETRSGVVTVDDDLQHDIDDVKTCAEKMELCGKAVFGARDFKRENVPAKSKIGNNITAFVFRFICGIRLSDTQTGLRALPRSYLPALLTASGNGFEYETNMLLTMKQNELDFEETPIKTIYSDNNRSTHFAPLKDSVKIYAVIFKYILSSLSAALIDLAIFTLLNMLIPSDMDEGIRIFVATAFARIVSSAINFAVNRQRVFKSKGNLKASIVKYYILCVCQMAASYGLVCLITMLASTTQSLLQTVFKMIVDIVLFFFCFAVQREWVFKDNEHKKGKER